MSAMDDLKLVAHRGYPAAFPENTLLGYDQAAMHGAAWVETDVQCTRDGVPVLYHDADTRRLSGRRGRLYEWTLAQLEELSAHYPDRFGDRFEGVPIPTLKAFAGWLAQHPSVAAFIEIKKESLKKFGIEPVMERVIDVLEGVEERCVIISFDDRCVEYAAARRSAIRAGWVLPAWNAATERRASELSPEFLFADGALLPDSPEDLWQGPWAWAVYVVDDLARALSHVERGAHFVETDAIGDVLNQYRASGPAAG